MTCTRCGSPFSAKYCRASLSAAGDERFGERLHRLVAEERGVRVVQQFELLADRVDHRAAGVAEAGDRGAARGVEIALAFAVLQVDAVAGDRDGIVMPRIAMEDVRHATNIA